jgi:hypothetical protein
MDSILTLSNRAAQLRHEVDIKRHDASIVTHSSFNHGRLGEYEIARSEAAHAMTLGQETGRFEQRALEAEQQVVSVEQRIIHLLQDAVVIRDDNFHRIGYIDGEALQKLDALYREIHTLRG